MPGLTIEEKEALQKSFEDLQYCETVEERAIREAIDAIKRVLDAMLVALYPEVGEAKK